MSAPTRRAPNEILSEWLDRAQACLLLFPALTLAWPGPNAPLGGDLYPALTGTGFAAFASLPALSMMVLRRATARTRWTWAFLGFVALGLLSTFVQPPADTLYAARAELLAAIALAMLVAGASLRRDGPLWLARGLGLLTFVALVPALGDGAQRFAGTLGNTGSTSELALLGAAAGAWLAAREQGVWRWLGLLAAALFAFYTGFAPVFAGALSLATVLALGALLERRARARWAVLLAACALAFGAGRLAPRDTAPPAAVSVNAGDWGGLDVRRRIWSGTARLIADYGIVGVGPGQFAAAFPPYRDPREIELSSHGRRERGVEREVEHPHSDLLQGFVDGGPLGGLLWLAFLGAVAWRALRALKEHDTARAALAAAALAILVNSTLREPLLYDPASSSAAFAVFGALLAGEVVATPRAWLLRSFVGLAIAALLVQIPRAWSIGLHGRAMLAHVRDGSARHLDFALNACPDSPAARAALARTLEASAKGEPSRATTDAWRDVLELRPHNVEALIQLGIAHARSERVDEARAAWQRALVLDPEHPALLDDLADMEAFIGDIDTAIEWLEREHADVPAKLRAYAAGSFRALRVERGWALLARVDARFADLNAERAHQLSQAAGTGLAPDGALTLDEALALEGSAQLTWARENGERGDAAAAVRSYRQAKRCLARTGADGLAVWPKALHYELAGALAASGKLDEARAELEGVHATTSELARLPLWVGEALMRAGLLAP